MKNRPSGFGIEQLPRIVRGQGSYLFDAAGNRYLDGSGGPAVFCLGHAHPEVNAAIARQFEEIAYAYRYLFTSSALEDLTETVLRLCGGGFQDIVFTGSGSEAVESALKIALQYFAARGQMSKRRFIARRRSWHGNTLGALSISDFSQRRRAFEGSLLDVTFVSAANAYRPPVGIAAQDLSRHLAADSSRPSYPWARSLWPASCSSPSWAPPAAWCRRRRAMRRPSRRFAASTMFC